MNADSDASTHAPDRQRTASASSSTSSSRQASDPNDSASHNSTDTGADSADSDDSRASLPPSAQPPSAPAPPRARATPLPPPMVLLRDVDHLVLPFDWRQRAAPQQRSFDSAPLTQSSDSSEGTTASDTSAAATHSSPRLRPRGQPSSPISPMSPLTSSSALWHPHHRNHHHHEETLSRASTSDPLGLLSRRNSDSSLWRSGPVSYAPTPAAGEFLSPILSPAAGSSVDLTDHAAGAEAIGSSGGGARPGAMSPGAVDAVDVAGALAQLPGASRRPTLRLEGLPLPISATSASSSAISVLHSIPWVDHSPEPIDEEPAPWAKQGRGSSPWSSPRASTSGHRLVRSPSAVSQHSVVSDGSDVAQMDQSIMSSVSLISQHSAVSSETRRLSSWHEDMARGLTASEGHTAQVEPGETTPRDDLSSDSREPSDIEYFSATDAASEVSAHDAQEAASATGESADEAADEYAVEANDVALFRLDRHERIACANSAAATLRSLLLPTPLTHVPHCLSRGKDHLAVLVPSGHGTSTLQVLWLGAPERALAPVTTPSHASRLPLQWGLSIAPPLGRRGAVPPPVVGEHPVDEAPGSTLLATLFSIDDPPKTRLAPFQQQYVMGFVTASPTTPPHASSAPGAAEVVWHSGPGAEHQWRQPLMTVRQPQVQLSPDGSALLLISATPQADPFHVSHVLDGVWLFVMRRIVYADGDVAPDGMAEGRRWALREPHSLLPPGSTRPTFAWTKDDQSTLMVSQHGVRLFDTHVTELRQELHLPVPKELAVPGGRIAAGPVSFDGEQRNVAVNWTTYTEAGEPRLRMAQVVRLDTARGAAQLPPKRAETWTTAASPHPYEMMHFIGDRGDALWARAHDSKLIFRPKPIEAPNVANARTYGGATETFTEDHKHLLVPLGAGQSMAAMLSHGRMRLYISYGASSRPAQRRFAFAEKNPAMLQALRQRGVEPSPNRLTVAPWFEAQERFMYLGFDDDVLQRYDLVPNQGRLPPELVQPNQQGVATYDPQKTLWTQNHAPH